MELKPVDTDHIKRDVVTASHVLHQQGVAAAFGHVSARIPGTDRFIFPPRMRGGKLSAPRHVRRQAALLHIGRVGGDLSPGFR